MCRPGYQPCLRSMEGRTWPSDLSDQATASCSRNGWRHVVQHCQIYLETTHFEKLMADEPFAWFQGLLSTSCLRLNNSLGLLCRELVSPVPQRELTVLHIATCGNYLIQHSCHRSCYFPILQIEKASKQEVKELAPSHTACLWQSQHSHPVYPPDSTVPASTPLLVLAMQVGCSWELVEAFI